jgi:hypothetical protein
VATAELAVEMRDRCEAAFLGDDRDRDSRAAGMRLKAPANDHQRDDWAKWCPGAVVGDIIDTPKNPVIYPRPAP